MTRIRTVTAVAALLLAVAGCSTESPTPAPSPSTAARTAAQTAYLEALRKIDPGLVAKEDRAITRGESTCQTIESGNTHAKIVTMTAERFTGGGVEINSAEAERIVEAAQTHLCPA